MINRRTFDVLETLVTVGQERLGRQAGKTLVDKVLAKQGLDHIGLVVTTTLEGCDVVAVTLQKLFEGRAPSLVQTALELPAPDGFLSIQCPLLCVVFSVECPADGFDAQ